MGLVKKHEIAVRKKEIEDIIIFIETLKNDIFYRKLTVDKILTSPDLACLNIFLSEMASSPVQPILQRYYSVKNAVKSKMSLHKDDWKYADELFGILGKTDESSQCEIFERILKDLRTRKKDLMEESEKMGGFYVKMWLAVGSLFVIICV